LVCDFIVRQKIGGTDIAFHYIKQFAVLSFDIYDDIIINKLKAIGLQIIYTSWDLKSVADNVWDESDEDFRNNVTEHWDESNSIDRSNNYSIPIWHKAYPEIKWNQNEGCPLPPFKWDEERRAKLRAELDAYFALLYGLERVELRYILDPQDVYGDGFPGETFRVLKEKEIRQYGEYRTRRLVLEAYDKLRPTWDMETHIKKLEETWAKYQVDNNPKLNTPKTGQASSKTSAENQQSMSFPDAGEEI